MMSSLLRVLSGGVLKLQDSKNRDDDIMSRLTKSQREKIFKVPVTFGVVDH